MNKELKNKYIICSCEGKAERAVMNILLDNDLLCFSRNDLVDEDVTLLRSARDIERQFMGRAFRKEVVLLRIIDSRKDIFVPSKAYAERYTWKNIYTTPEIEMLIILAEGKYSKYNAVKSEVKPSDYCKNVLGYSDVKQEEFVKRYFANPQKLVKALSEYRQKQKRANENCLFDLLKKGSSPK